MDRNEPSKVDNTAVVCSHREIELEDMLSGLKEKFSTLRINDLQKLIILAIAPKSMER